MNTSDEPKLGGQGLVPTEVPQAGAAGSVDSESLQIEPDLDFIRTLISQGGDSLKKCFQCGTCSGTCDISPDIEPFPRKEMVWALWGMKDRLLADPDVWLCYQCNDCSGKCPRGAQPGEVLSAVRKECVRHYAVPHFMGRWVGKPHCIPLLIGITATLLAASLAAKAPIEDALNISRYDEHNIIFSYTSLLPHWIINSFFGFFAILAVILAVAGCLRYYRAMKAAVPAERIDAPVKSVGASMWSVFKGIVVHDKFDKCTRSRSRFLSHLLLFYGFFALITAVIWMVTTRYNPLVVIDFKYPLAFLDPWKMLANLGGVAVLVGVLLMIRDRIVDAARIGIGGYFDWFLLLTVLAVAVTGFATELMHYFRLEPHRHVVYFVHLVLVGALLMYIPYSKMAHMFYRATALVFAERYGRETGLFSAPAQGTPNPGAENEEIADVAAAPA